MEDISGLQDSSFKGVRYFEQDYISTGVGKIVASQTTHVSGYPAQKIIYIEQGIGNDIFKKSEDHVISFWKDHVLIYYASNEHYFDPNF